MPVVFDYTKTTAYEKGVEQGAAKGEAKKLTEMVYAMFAQKLDFNLIATIANLPLPTIQAMHQEWQKTQN